MIRTLVECAIMLALATVLSFIKLWKMPYGGSITPVSMLPIALIANKYGNKVGLFTAFGYSLIQMIVDLPDVASWGLTPGIFVACLLLDYLIAYTVLGFAGTFRKYKYWGVLAGITLAFFLRFLSHFASGVALWGSYAADYGFANPWIYSLAYNGAYMGVELGFSLVIAFILFRIPVIEKMIAPVGQSSGQKTAATESEEEPRDEQNSD